MPTEPTSSGDDEREQLSSPAISVVVPFFESERYIASSIESLLEQRDVAGGYEVLLINNRSTDSSQEIVERYPELVVLYEETPGAYAARNTGIRAAKGQILAFTDADCVVADDWLRSVQQSMQDPEVAVVIGKCRFPKRSSLALRALGAYENAKADYVINRCGRDQHFAYANNMAVRASIFDELGLFREWQRAGDSELVHRLAAKRPDLRLAYNPKMRMTHLEFLKARARLQRLLLYSKTNTQIESFRELESTSRMGILLRLLRLSRRQKRPRTGS